MHHTPCAIKVLKSISPDVAKKLLPTIRKEVEIMKRNNHPNIVGLLCVCNHSDNNIYITMPLMKGNLEGYIKLHGASLSSLKRLSICYEILLGMTWLHSQEPSILHLDLKMENILFDEKNTMKITDFGLSALLSEDVGYVESRLRTPGNVGHMSPEVIQRRRFDEKADVYSMGVLMWEIMKGCEWESEVVDQLRQMKIPLSGSLREIVKRAVCTRDLRPSLLKVDWPDSFKNLLQRMWAGRPEDRPTLSFVLENDFNDVKRDFKFQVLRNTMIDPTGQRFWLETVDDIEEKLPWAKFKSAFYSFFNLKIPASEKNLADPDTKNLIYLKTALNAQDNEMVSLDRFGCVIDAFGPVVVSDDQGSSFFSQIQETLSHRWFRSDLLQEDALTYLKGQEDGTFVVRFSSKVGVPFTLTRVKKGKVHHVRIYKLPEGLRIGEADSKWNRTFFKSIGEIVSNSDIRECFQLILYPMIVSYGKMELVFLATPEDTNYRNESLGNSGTYDDIIAAEPTVKFPNA